jgi:hypothetical protein
MTRAWSSLDQATPGTPTPAFYSLHSPDPCSRNRDYSPLLARRLPLLAQPGGQAAAVPGWLRRPPVVGVWRLCLERRARRRQTYRTGTP